MMDTYYSLDNDVYISDKQLNKICDSFFESIKKELPEEAQNYEILEFLIEHLEQKAKKLIIK